MKTFGMVSAAFNSWKQKRNTGTCGSLNTGSNAPRVMTCDTRSSSGTCRLLNDLIVADTSSWKRIIISRDSNQSLPLSSCCCSWVSLMRSRWGNELSEGMGVGQPLSMKLKNVHLPHPHPNGGFWDPSVGEGLVLLPSGSLSISSSFPHTGSKSSLGEGPVLPWYLAAAVVGLSKVRTLAAASGGVVMLSWVRTSVDRGVRFTHITKHALCIYAEYKASNMDKTLSF